MAVAIVLGCAASVTAGDAGEWRRILEEARLAWRTNSTVALALCDRAVSGAESNAGPWLLRAAVRDSRREYDQALRDVSTALQLNSNLAEAWQLRGTIHFKLARFRASVQDFDRFLAAAPDRRPYHWQRGISLYYAGEYEEARRQFELHETVNPNDVENAVWHFLCVARLKGVESARQGLLKPGRDARVPMSQILALFAGKGSVEQVVAAANASREPDALFYAELYLGLYCDSTGDARGARDHIAKAVALNRPHYMGDVARVHAKAVAPGR